INFALLLVSIALPLATNAAAHDELRALMASIDKLVATIPDSTAAHDGSSATISRLERSRLERSVATIPKRTVVEPWSLAEIRLTPDSLGSASIASRCDVDDVIAALAVKYEKDHSEHVTMVQFPERGRGNVLAAFKKAQEKYALHVSKAGRIVQAHAITMSQGSWDDTTHSMQLGRYCDVGESEIKLCLRPAEVAFFTAITSASKTLCPTAIVTNIPYSDRVTQTYGFNFSGPSAPLDWLEITLKPGGGSTYSHKQGRGERLLFEDHDAHK
ncbi:MAG TPA: hypothetical protein VJJ83_02445, partial [Candidatus Babeliales bacterium]|nr:hypothetical protein [Candidatus Babeliales bacterium]